MYAMCPNCNHSIKDDGKLRIIKCNNCGNKIRSRNFKLGTKDAKKRSLHKKGHETGQPDEKIKSTTLDDEDDFDLYPPLGSRSTIPRRPSKVPKPKNEMYYYSSSNRSSSRSPIRRLMGVMCTLAIISVFVLIFINFIAFFPAIAITLPELNSEHHLDLETEFIIIIDDTPPNISNIQNQSIKYLPGQQVSLMAEVTDEHFRDMHLELNYGSIENTSGSGITEFPVRYNQEMNLFIGKFLAPIEPGKHTVNLIATDYAGNSNRVKIDLEVQNPDVTKAIFILSDPEKFPFINSSTELQFLPMGDDISKVTYRIDNQLVNYTLEPPYTISTSDWLEGEHQLNITITSINDQISYLNLSFIFDNTKPEIINSPAIIPLTINRNETFRDKLSGNNYYRGEFVSLELKLKEPHLNFATVELEDLRFQLIPNEMIPTSQDQPIIYKTIISMPDSPGEYQVQIELEDLAGNSQKITEEIKIAKINFDYIPVPIITLEQETAADDINNLMMINKSFELALKSTPGKLIDIKYQSTGISGQDNSITTNTSDDTRIISFLEAAEGGGKLHIKAQVTFHNWDWLFFTLPFPPYLFLIPIVLIGWSLVAFFIFIALTIILSNLFLFKSSINGAVNTIEDALSKYKAPMMESKNSMIMLSQIFLAVFSFNVLYNLILAWGDVSVHTPDFSSLSTWTLIYNLTSAAVYEEIITRLLLIGIPLLIIHGVTKNLKKPLWKYFLGGGLEINKLTIILILFSSVTFGLAHAPGWDYWKVVPTFISSLALGYIFLEKGIFASIMLHFTINFLTIPLHMLDYPLGPTIIYSLLIYFWIFIGLIYFGYYGKKAINAMNPNKKIKASKNSV